MVSLHNHANLLPFRAADDGSGGDDLPRVQVEDKYHQREDLSLSVIRNIKMYMAPVEEGFKVMLLEDHPDSGPEFRRLLSKGSYRVLYLCKC